LAAAFFALAEVVYQNSWRDYTGVYVAAGMGVFMILLFFLTGSGFLTFSSSSFRITFSLSGVADAQWSEFLNHVVSAQEQHHGQKHQEEEVLS
jgi:hypothetical protein